MIAASDSIRVEIERVGSDVDKYRDGPHPGDGLSRREERVRSGDHLVAGAHADRFQCQQQGVGTVGHTHSVGGAELGGHLLFELAYLRAEDEPTRVDNLADSLLDVGQQLRVLPVNVH